MKDIIFNLIKKEEDRQLKGLELIASENFVSKPVLEACGSILTNKYAEGYPGKRYYGGCKIIDEIEQLAIDRLKKLFNVEYANVQPHSGSQANSAVFFTCLKPGDTILGFNLAHGGHLTHGSPVNFSGSTYNAVFYGVDKNTGLIDYNELEHIAKKEKPKLIIAGASSYSRDFDFKKFRTIADSINAILIADISHPAGLIAKGLLQDPTKYCHIITSTTHKTLRGPRGGIIMMGKDFENPFGLKLKNGSLKKMSTLLDSGVFPGNQGGPLEHIIAAKAIAFEEALSDNYTNYVTQVQKNAQCLAKALINKDYNIISGGTDNHMMLIDLRNKNVNGKEAQNALEYSDITLNKNMVPYDSESPFITSGIRIGTAAITTRGLLEDDMNLIADLIDKVICDHTNPSTHKEVSNIINEFMYSKPLFKS